MGAFIVFSFSLQTHSFASQWSYFCSLDFDFALNGFLFDSNRVKCLEREMSLCDSFEIQCLPAWIDWSAECSSVDIKWRIIFQKPLKSYMTHSLYFRMSGGGSWYENEMLTKNKSNPGGGAHPQSQQSRDRSGKIRSSAACELEASPGQARSCLKKSTRGQVNGSQAAFLKARWEWLSLSLQAHCVPSKVFLISSWFGLCLWEQRSAVS